MSGMRRQVNAIIKTLERDHGCVAKMTKGSHWRVTREGFPPVTISHSPSDPRAVDNIKADVRRYLGINLGRK